MEDLVTQLTYEELAVAVAGLMRAHPELITEVAALLAKPAMPGAKVSRKRRNQVDAWDYRNMVRGIFRGLNDARRPDDYQYRNGLASDLGDVLETAKQHVADDDPESGLAILMVLAEELLVGRDFLYDLGGSSLGDFALGLGLPMAEAFLGMDLSASEREAWAEQIEGLDMQLSNLGMGDLNVALAALEHGWTSDPVGETAPGQDQDDIQALIDASDISDDDVAYIPNMLHSGGDLIDARLNVLERHGNSDDFLAESKRAGRHLRTVWHLLDLKRTDEAVAHAVAHLTRTDEAYETAKRLHEAAAIDDAIRIAELGLTLAGRKSLLGEWLGPVEEAQGREPQALQAYCAAFYDHRKLDTYKTIKRLCRSGWAELQARLLQALRATPYRQPLIDVLLYEALWDEAIAVVSSHRIEDRLVAQVVDVVTAHRPAWVVTACQREAEITMDRKQARFYEAAADWLERVKAAMEVMGQTDDWMAYLARLKAAHNRQPSLQKVLRML